MRSLRACIAVIFSFQALAILAANFPPGTALTNVVLAPFSAYLTATEQWQTWDMFDTIPYDRAFTVKAFAVDVNGKETEVGPILPGLTPFTPDLRTQTFFYRIYPGTGASNQYWETYAQRLCAAAKADASSRQMPQVATMYVDFISDRLRSLAEIRNDLVLSRRTTASRGPFQCGANG